MLILLPPSEGKTSPVRGRPMRPDTLSFPSLHPARAQVLDALVSLCTTDSDAGVAKAAQVLGLGKTQLDEVRRDAGLLSAPATRADRVYSGVLYEALGLATLDAAARRRASSWVAVTSALFGLVRPGDAIPAYRLSGDVALPRIGNVAGFWKQHLDAAVRDAAGRGIVVDLRSSTYAKFWRPGPDLAPRVVTVRVLHEVDGHRKVVSHFNKATKGRLVRALLEDGRPATTPEGLADQLSRLGWRVEQTDDGGHGNRLDVMVAEL